MASLSRQLAQWVVGLRYEDLPPEVVDRAKGVTLHSLASVLLGSQSRDGQQAVKLITAEEAGVRHGASIMVHGTKVTKGGAAFANAEMAMAGGKLDSFRMLTHPGTSIVPGAFVAAETAGVSGRDFLTGLVAGYEVMERMAADFIPTVMARGFHAGPVFGIFGPAVAAAKILRFTEDQVNSTIALCASLASRQPRRASERRPCPARGRRGAQRHAGGGAGAAGARGRRDRPGRPRWLLSRLCGQQQGPAHLQLCRRHPDQPGQDYGQSGEGLAVPRDALPHLLDGWLQHRPRRRHGAALRRAQYPI